MRIGDIMSTSVETIAPGTSADQAIEMMKRKAIHHLVVVDGGHVALDAQAPRTAAEAGRPDTASVGPA